MTLLSPVNHAFVGGLTTFAFDPSVLITDIAIEINGEAFHFMDTAHGYKVDLNNIVPGIPIHIKVIYPQHLPIVSDEIVVTKPLHNLGGMGATVIRNAEGTITGTFFKFWLPDVRNVFVRGAFNNWTDANRLDQLDNTGYWYGFSADARPGDDYRFFVYTKDGKFKEVSDPVARETYKTKHNTEDAQDANAIIVDTAAFTWLHDDAFANRRKQFSTYNIYQLHWGTFLRKTAGGNFEKFVTGSTDAEKRSSARNKLTYIRDLGFTALQLLPVHQANGNFNAGYDPSFFFAVESAYGDPEGLRMVVDEAHGLGLAVIFDAVINHLTKDESYSSFSQNFIKGWYTKENAPWSNHNQWGGEDWGPDPDFDRDEICDLLRDCIRMYLDEYHVDGVRFDGTTTIPRHGLQSIISRLQQEYAGQGKYLIAEHITDNPFPYIIQEIGFHAAWDKNAWNAVTYQVIGQPGQGNLQALRQVFETNGGGNPSTAIKYLLGAHDEQWGSHGGKAATIRFGNAANWHTRSKMRLAWALNACALGTPMFFMGTEGMTDITWDNFSGYNGWDWKVVAGEPPAQFQTMIKDINELRLRLGAFRTTNSQTELVHMDDRNGIAAYKRWDLGGSVLLIVINISDNQWEHREYGVRTNTPVSNWHQIFNSQEAVYGGWAGSGNTAFDPKADGSGRLQGINIPKWSLLIFQQQLA